jgi:plastocyanin
MKRYCVTLLMYFTCAAYAGDTQVVVRDAAGAPVENAVVSFTPASGGLIKASDLKGPFTMAQQNITFVPYVLAVPKGAVVAFPNYDRVNHHVYSFSPAQKFQLPLYGKGKSYTITFATPGTVALGCNIHDSMKAYIRVVGTPFYAKTNAQGQVTLTNLPNEDGSLSVWHPMMAAVNGEVIEPAPVARMSKPISLSVRLRPRAGNDAGL